MKKIAFIELDTHAEIAGIFFELMQDSKQFKVDFYFASKIVSQLNLVENKTVIQTSADKILKQISAEKYDLVILGTVHRDFNIYLKLIKENNVAIICHNLNFCSISKATLFKSIFKKEIKYRLKLLFKEGLLWAPKVFDSAKNLLVLDEDLLKNKSVNQKKMLQFLPLFFTKFNKNLKTEITKIVIPGSVSQKRRDYQNLIIKLSEFKTLEKFQFVFLGKADGKELTWLKDLEKKLATNISIKYFTEKVSTKEFDENMNGAHFLWCPVQNETEFFSQKEIYGETKMSGNIGDAIKYGKTAIFSETYFSTKPFIIKEEINIESQISNLKTENSFDFQRQFNKEKIRNEFEKVLKNLT
ncbi:hypothetical protein [Halpernia sp.]|uniref:hypothetical protein n=1 Tax=Halpernia sp. TaxID=2782209 RepID=UPI003A9450FC